MKASDLLLFGFLFAGFLQCSNELLENNEVQNEDSFDVTYELIEYLKNLPSKAELAAKAIIHVAEHENRPQYPLPPLKLIQNKFDNLTKIAGGAFIGESIRNGNITFARVVTYLMIADQFPPQSNWVDILTKYRGEDESELDELAQEIEIFEDFVENNTISYLLDDNVAEKVANFIKNCQNIKMMAEQVEKFEALIVRIQNISKEKAFRYPENWDTVTIVTNLPFMVESLIRFDVNSPKMEELKLGREPLLEVIEADKLNTLIENIKVLAELPSFAKRTIGQEYSAMESAKYIEETFNITQLLSFDEEFIEDCANVFWLSGISDSYYDDVEKLIENIEYLENLQWLFELKTTIDQSFNLTTLDDETSYQNEKFSNLLRILKSRSKIISLAEKMKKKIDPDATSREFINSADFANSQISNITINGMRNIDLPAILTTFHQIGKQMEEVQNWLSKLEHGDAIYDAIRYANYMNMKNNGTRNISLLENYERLAREMDNLVMPLLGWNTSVEFHNFLSKLRWLKSNPGLFEKLRAFRFKAEHEFALKVSIQTVSALVRFFRKLPVVNGSIQLQDISTIGDVFHLTRKVGECNSQYARSRFFELVKDGLTQASKKIKVTWETIPENNFTIVLWDKVRGAFDLVQKFYSNIAQLNETRHLLRDVQNSTEELNFMWKAGEVMENFDAGKYKEGLALMAKYEGSRNISVVNSTRDNCEKLKEHLLPDILANLTNGLQVYYDSLEGIKSAEHLEYLAEQVIYMDNVPKNVEYYLGNLTIWLSESSVLEVLSKEEIGMKLQRLLRNMPNIRMSLSRLIRWIEKIPKGADKKQLGKMKKSMAGREKETEFLAVLYFTEKVRDPKYTKTIRIIFENLEKLAKIFGYIDHSTLCQADAFGPYGSMCFTDKNSYCPAILQGDIAHWSSQYITITEIFLCFFIQFSFGLLILLKIHQRRNSIADYELKSFGVKIKDKEIKDRQEK